MLVYGFRQSRRPGFVNRDRSDSGTRMPAQRATATPSLGAHGRLSPMRVVGERLSGRCDPLRPAVGSPIRRQSNSLLNSPPDQRVAGWSHPSPRDSRPARGRAAHKPPPPACQIRKAWLPPTEVPFPPWLGQVCSPSHNVPLRKVRLPPTRAPTPPWRGQACSLSHHLPTCQLRAGAQAPGACLRTCDGGHSGLPDEEGAKPDQVRERWRALGPAK